MPSVATLTVHKADKAASLGDIDHAPSLNMSGNRCHGKAGLSIDATPADVQTTAAVDYSINGIMYTLAIQAAIDISAATFVDQEGTTLTTNPALATGYNQAWLFVADAAGAVKVVPGDAVAAGGTVRPPRCPANHAPIGAVKVENASGSNFTLGTTSLATAGVTDTYYDLALVPASL